jgi:hypothetical protein
VVARAHQFFTCKLSGLLVQFSAVWPGICKALANSTVEFGGYFKKQRTRECWRILFTCGVVNICSKIGCPNRAPVLISQSYVTDFVRC